MINGLTGPGSFLVDMSFRYSVPLKAGFDSLDLFYDIFNLFNRENLVQPDGQPCLVGVHDSDRRAVRPADAVRDSRSLLRKDQWFASQCVGRFDVQWSCSWPWGRRRSPRHVAAGQMELAVIQGTVKDEAGKPLEGVTFRLKDMGRGSETSVKSDKNGRFYRRGLQAVEYELVVEKDGYQPINDKIRLTAGENSRRFDFKLVKAAPEGAGDFAKGVEAYNRGDNAAAAQAFEAAMAKAPELPEIHVNLALAYFKLQRTADAVAQLEKAASLAPDDRRACCFSSAAPTSRCRRSTRRWRRSRRGSRSSRISSDPLVVGSDRHARRGVLRQRARTTRRSRSSRRRWRRSRMPPAPTLGLGKVHFSKGDVAKALELFQKVVDVGARDAGSRRSGGVHQGAQEAATHVARSFRAARVAGLETFAGGRICVEHFYC